MPDTIVRDVERENIVACGAAVGAGIQDASTGNSVAVTSSTGLAVAGGNSNKSRIIELKTTAELLRGIISKLNDYSVRVDNDEAMLIFWAKGKAELRNAGAEVSAFGSPLTLSGKYLASEFFSAVMALPVYGPIVVKMVYDDEGRQSWLHMSANDSTFVSVVCRGNSPTVEEVIPVADCRWVHFSEISSLGKILRNFRSICPGSDIYVQDQFWFASTPYANGTATLRVGVPPASSIGKFVIPELLADRILGMEEVNRLGLFVERATGKRFLSIPQKDAVNFRQELVPPTDFDTNLAALSDAFVSRSFYGPQISAAFFAALHRAAKISMEKVTLWKTDEGGWSLTACRQGSMFFRQAIKPTFHMPVPSAVSGSLPDGVNISPKLLLEAFRLYPQLSLDFSDLSSGYLRVFASNFSLVIPVEAF